jgi:NAD(P)-dependent dehydrogenase (short-subunit alcohol dehydrogenase family)
VQKFLSEGAKVVIADFSEKVGTATAQELGCEFHLTDVTKGEQWEACLKKTLDAYGKIDIVINNAGTTYRNQPNAETTEQHYDMVMNVNVKSIFFSTQKIVPQMQKAGNGGVFVNIASTAGIRPRPGLIWYNASKAAVINATKCLAVEYAKDNIRFLSVCPVVGMGTGL